MSNSPPFHIAIDGPAGSGKSTAARGVSRALGITYIDTGAMYRAVALKIRRARAEGRPGSWAGIASHAELGFLATPDGQHVLIDGEDVEPLIRTPEMSELTSRVSADADVRAAVTDAMREMARRTNAVLEGRDIGTVVLPNAALKVFLAAPEAVRAGRRARDLTVAGCDVSSKDMEREIRERDERDSSRDTAPLAKAPDAIEIDTEALDADGVVRRIVEIARERGFSP